MTKEYPVLPVVMPADIAKAENGKLPDGVLKPLKGFPTGRLHRMAATAFNAMQLAAFFDKIELRPVSPTDTYRPFEVQDRIFYQRYTDQNNGAKVTRQHAGKTWYLLPGKAPCSSPGKSNHGWGLAVDIANCSGSRLDWLLGGGGLAANALKFGFSWETTPGKPGHEDWHIRLVTGDKPTQAVLDMVKAFPELDAR
jgi:LAS superfamily LD-carboxypeptidase LdcB